MTPDVVKNYYASVEAEHNDIRDKVEELLTNYQVCDGVIFFEFADRDSISPQRITTRWNTILDRYNRFSSHRNGLDFGFVLHKKKTC